MKNIFTSQDPLALIIVRDLISEEGIETAVLNEGMGAVEGDIPHFQSMPELWVVRDEDEAAAREVVRRYESGDVPKHAAGAAWNCPRCGEAIEGQFTACWKCGTARTPA